MIKLLDCGVCMDISGVGGPGGYGEIPQLTPRGEVTSKENFAQDRCKFILKKFEKAPLSPEDKKQILQATDQVKSTINELKFMADNDPDRKIFSADEAECLGYAKNWVDQIEDTTNIYAIEYPMQQLRLCLKDVIDLRPK